jgi:hypothetical protein
MESAGSPLTSSVHRLAGRRLLLRAAGVGVGSIAAVLWANGSAPAGGELVYVPLFGLGLGLWHLRLESTGAGAVLRWSAIATAAWQAAAAPSAMHQVTAAGGGVFVFLLLWCLTAYEKQPGLQALATAALLLSAGILIKPAVAIACAVLCLTFFAGHLRRTAEPLGFGLLLFTPAVLCGLAVLAFQFVSAGVLAAGPLLSTSMETPAGPALHLVLLPAAVLIGRLITGRTGSADVAFLFMCFSAAVSRGIHWPAGAVAGADLFYMGLGGGAALLAASGPRGGPARADTG